MELDTSRLDLNLLAALDVLLRERNVTRAAKKLGITQSAMSHKLKRLREELGDPLFVTAPGGLAPTARAESLEEPLRRALQDVAAAVRASAPFDPSTAEREVRVACVDAIELTLLPEILARLAREAPKIRLSIRRRGPRSMEELASGELDLIVAPGGVPGVGYDELPGVQRRLLGADGFACVVRADHPLVRKRLTLSRFLELDHLLVTPGGTSLGVVDQVLAKDGLSRRVAVTIPSFVSAPLLVARTDLVLTCPTSVAEVASRVVPLRVLTPPIALPTIPLFLFWHVRVQHDPAHRWIREFVLSTFVATAAGKAGRPAPTAGK